MKRAKETLCFTRWNFLKTRENPTLSVSTT